MDWSQYPTYVNSCHLQTVVWVKYYYPDFAERKLRHGDLSVLPNHTLGKYQGNSLKPSILGKNLCANCCDAYICFSELWIHGSYSCQCELPEARSQVAVSVRGHQLPRGLDSAQAPANLQCKGGGKGDRTRNTAVWNVVELPEWVHFCWDQNSSSNTEWWKQNFCWRIHTVSCQSIFLSHWCLWRSLRPILMAQSGGLCYGFHVCIFPKSLCWNSNADVIGGALGDVVALVVGDGGSLEVL